jgi:hypothetical protein
MVCWETGLQSLWPTSPMGFIWCIFYFSVFLVGGFTVNRSQAIGRQFIALLGFL